MTTAMTTRTRCEFEQGYRDFDGSSATATCSHDATTLVWFPPTGEQFEDPNGEVVAFCADHLDTVRADARDEFDTVLIATLPMRCASCHEPVWAKHAHPHATVKAEDCEWCHGLAEARAKSGLDIPTATEHAACSCPEFAAWLRAMGESDDAR